MEANIPASQETRLSKSVYLDSKVRPPTLTVSVSSSKQVPEVATDIVALFNKYGAVIVQFEEKESPQAQLLCFTSVFGEVMMHDRSAKDGITEIAVSSQFQGYLGTSNLEHEFHTDGAYTEHSPTVVALRCETPAKQGGVTKLASGEAVYQHLVRTNPGLIDSLAEEDALCVFRAGQQACQPVFRRDQDRFSIRYRADQTVLKSTNDSVRQGIVAIRDFLQNSNNFMSFKLESNQVLITDNTRTLHARTSFPESEPRQMHRLFFDGTSPYQLLFGFRA